MADVFDCDSLHVGSKVKQGLSGGELLSRILDLRTALRTETGCHMVRTGDRGPEKGGRFL